MRCINDFEDVARRPVVGFIEYLDWLEAYKESDKEGQLAVLFCAAFDVEDQALMRVEDDRIADSLIRSSYTYDDFVTDES